MKRSVLAVYTLLARSQKKLMSKHLEWQEKLRNIELTLQKMEREPNIRINDLDMALILLTKVSELYSRLDEKHKSTLLQILAKRIIVNSDGEIIDHVLNSPFSLLAFRSRLSFHP